MPDEPIQTDFPTDPAEKARAVSDVFLNAYGRNPNEQELSYWSTQPATMQQDLLATMRAQQQPAGTMGTTPTPTPQTTPAASTPFDPNALLSQYGGQYNPQQYLQAAEAAGFEAQLISGYAPSLQYGNNVLSDELKVGEKETQSFAERSALPTTGTAKKVYSYWDDARGVRVNAPAGQHFELYPGGGVKNVPGLIQKATITQQASDPNRTSLFDQPASLQAPGTYDGKTFKQEQLAYQPIEGKTIARTGQTAFNPTTGVDEEAGPGEVLIEYTDGTVERRKIGGGPGTAVPLGEFGRTAEELGIDRTTEIKGPGGEIARAPQTETVEQIVKRGGSVQEIENRIKAAGLAATSDLTFLGTTRDGKTAKEGNAFYQAPDGTVLERPAILQSIAKKPQTEGQADTAPRFSSELKSSFDNLGLGVDEQTMIQALRDRPIPNVQQLYTAIQTAQGVPTIQAQLKQIQDEMKALDDKYADDKASIDENPWLSESLRSRKQSALGEKYETKRAQLVNRQQLNQSLLQDARQEAQFIAGTAIQQANADRAFDMSLLQLSFERADQKFASQIQLAQLEMEEEKFTESKRQFDIGSALEKQKIGISEKQFGAELQFKERQFQEEIRQFNVQQARLRSGGGGGGTLTERALAQAGGIGQQLEASRGKDGYVDPGVFNSLRAQALMSPGEFNSRYGSMVNPKDRSNLGIGGYSESQKQAQAGDRFISSEWFKSIYTEDQLHEQSGVGFFTKDKSGQVDNYLRQIMQNVEAYRQAGFTDEEIFKLMK